MNSRTTQVNDLRDSLVALYQHRTYQIPNYAARTRLYGDVFADALVKQGYLQSSLTVSEMFWLPRCIALHDVGYLAGADSATDLPRLGSKLIKRCDSIWGMRPFSKCLAAIVANFYGKSAVHGQSIQLKSAAIPLSARFARIVATYTQTLDDFDLTNEIEHSRALQTLLANQCDDLDTELVEIFVGLDQQLVVINRDMENALVVLEACA